MLKTIIKLPDGTQISSGKIMDAAIQSCTITECVNSGEELTLGSACAASLEATVLITGGDPNIAAGDEVTVCKQDGDNEPVQVGVFILEKPTRTTANTMKITGYDRVSKLDKDLTVWLAGLKEWPYTLTCFARMVCKACGLDFKVTDVPNQDFQVQRFTRSAVTGRQIMQWLGEICARFCRATPKGEIEFAWYADSGKEITTSGELYYFQNGLSYENYEVARVDAVQLRLADSASSALWPAADDGANSYIIAGNPILNLQITETLLPVLANIQAVVADAAYTPCQVNIPANLDIHAGNTVKITDKNGKTIIAYVMSKTQTGQKDTLECTGSRRRDTSASANNKTAAEKTAEAEGYADSAAQSAVDGQTQEQIYLKLTNDEKLKGLFMENGELYVNASYLKSGKISADLIDGTTLNITTGATIAGWDIDENSIYSGSFDTGVFMCRGSYGAFNIGGSDSITGWVFGAGGKYGVTSSGSVWCSDIHATGGEIAGWTIDDNSISTGSLGKAGSMWLCRSGTSTSASIGAGSGNGWCIGIGSRFGVKKDGTLYATGANIEGSLTTSGDEDDPFGVVVANGLIQFIAREQEMVSMYVQPFWENGKLRGDLYVHLDNPNNTNNCIISLGGAATQGEREYILNVGSSAPFVHEFYGNTKFYNTIYHSSGSVITSDKNSKQDIDYDVGAYSQLFDSLLPAKFKYNNGASDRIHLGLIAQDVEDAVLANGFTTKEFAAVCYDLDDDGNKTNYGVRYEELVPMCIYEIQKLKQRIAKIEMQ